jgi:hypothetical protein
MKTKELISNIYRVYYSSENCINVLSLREFQESSMKGAWGKRNQQIILVEDINEKML